VTRGLLDGFPESGVIIPPASLPPRWELPSGRLRDRRAAPGHNHQQVATRGGHPSGRPDSLPPPHCPRSRPFWLPLPTPSLVAPPLLTSMPILAPEAIAPESMRTSTLRLPPPAPAPAPPDENGQQNRSARGGRWWGWRWMWRWWGGGRGQRPCWCGPACCVSMDLRCMPFYSSLFVNALQRRLGRCVAHDD